jgi:hypothetical protein
MFIIYAFSLQSTLLHASIKLNTYLDTFTVGNSVGVYLLSPVVMSYRTILPSL